MPWAKLAHERFPAVPQVGTRQRYTHTSTRHDQLSLGMAPDAMSLLERLESLGQTPSEEVATSLQPALRLAMAGRRCEPPSVDYIDWGLDGACVVSRGAKVGAMQARGCYPRLIRMGALKTALWRCAESAGCDVWRGAGWDAQGGAVASP